MKKVLKKRNNKLVEVFEFAVKYRLPKTPKPTRPLDHKHKGNAYVFFPDTPGVYALKFSNGVKIGKALNLSKRISAYLHPWCRNVCDFYFIETDQINRAESLVLNACKEKWNVSLGSNEHIDTKNFDAVKEILNSVSRAVKGIAE